MSPRWKRYALRARLDVGKPAIAMAAHNPLAAKLATEAGFDAIWGSGFELSASYAVPDANILSMSVHLEKMRAMSEAQAGPVIADLDTGLVMRSTWPTSSRATRRPAGIGLNSGVSRQDRSCQSDRIGLGDSADRGIDRWLGAG